jgi:hypothetical protein
LSLKKTRVDRRGVGKTALMVEVKTAVEKRGALTFWINIQSMRSLSAYEAFLTTVIRICDLPAVVHADRTKKPQSVDQANDLAGGARAQLNARKISTTEVSRLIPKLQGMLQLFCRETREDLYLFLDDFHYLPIEEQPRYLDMMHGIIGNQYSNRYVSREVEISP